MNVKETIEMLEEKYQTKLVDDEVSLREEINIMKEQIKTFDEVLVNINKIIEYLQKNIDYTV